MAPAGSIMEELILYSINFKFYKMKLKNLLFGIFSLITLSIFSQNREKKVLATTSAVTEFQLKTSHIEELATYDWTTIKDVFEENDENQIIKLAFEYENSSEKRNSKPDIKNMKFEISGTTRELPELIEKSKRMVSKFIEINSNYND